jgi:hypothetical protein
MKTSFKFKSVITTSLLLLGFLLPLIAAGPAKSVKEELEQAKKLKKTVFMVVTANGINAVKAVKLAEQSQKKLKDAIVITLNRDDKTNAETVNSLKLNTAPLPMIMVIGMNGIAAGGLQEKEATVDKLVKMAPSPKKAEALSHLNDKKPVFVIGYRKSFTDRQKVVENVKSAITQLKGNAAYVEVDMDDAREKDMLIQIGAELKSAKTVVVVVNGQGKVMGNHSGITDAKTLASEAASAPKSCCPPGSGKSCEK